MSNTKKNNRAISKEIGHVAVFSFSFFAYNVGKPTISY